jgi:hypothetical protein
MCDYWAIVNNTETTPELVCEGEFNLSKIIYNNDIWNTIKVQSNANKT